MPALSLPPCVPHGYTYAEMGSAHRLAEARLAEECALAIDYNGLNHAVMMVSPTDLEDFIRGFSLSNGLLQSIEEIYDIHLDGTGEALEQALPGLAPLPARALPPATHLDDLRARIAEAQQRARGTGALHAALFVDERGEPRLCREDIGRHNALDKLIGALSAARLPAHAGFAVVTSRCSLELIHKAVRAGIGTLVSLSAPTALTVDWARRHGLNLIHLPHHSAPRVYSPAPSHS